MDTRPIACNLQAFTPEQAARHRVLWEQVSQAAGPFEELPDGYAAKFASPEFFTVLAEWVLLERLCCPFLSFALKLFPDQTLQLSLTGREGVKLFLQQQLGRA